MKKDNGRAGKGVESAVQKLTIQNNDRPCLLATNMAKGKNVKRIRRGEYKGANMKGQI